MADVGAPVNSASATGAGGGNSVTISAFSFAGANYGKISIGCRNNSASMGNITVTCNGSGTGISLKDTFQGPSARAGLWVYEALNPASGDIVVSWDGTQDNGRVAISCESFATVDVAGTPSGAAAHVSDAGTTTPNVNVTATTGNRVTTSTFTAGSNSIAPQAGQTERVEQAIDIGCLETSDRTAASTSQNVGSIVAGGDDVVLIGYQLNSGGGGGGGGFNPLPQRIIGTSKGYNYWEPEFDFANALFVSGASPAATPNVTATPKPTFNGSITPTDPVDVTQFVARIFKRALLANTPVPGFPRKSINNSVGLSVQQSIEEANNFITFFGNNHSVRSHGGSLPIPPSPNVSPKIGFAGAGTWRGM